MDSSAAVDGNRQRLLTRDGPPARRRPRWRHGLSGGASEGDAALRTHTAAGSVHYSGEPAQRQAAAHRWLTGRRSHLRTSPTPKAGGMGRAAASAASGSTAQSASRIRALGTASQRDLHWCRLHQGPATREWSAGPIGAAAGYRVSARRRRRTRRGNGRARRGAGRRDDGGGRRTGLGGGG